MDAAAKAIVFFSSILMFASSAGAQVDREANDELALLQDPPAAEDPAHAELRKLKEEVQEAVNKQDLDRLLAVLDPDVVVTWQNAEVSRKPQGVREYYDRMMKGPNPIVASLTSDTKVDELTHLYGDTGFAFGSSDDHFRLTDGREFTVHTRWSATVVKKDGKWLVAGVHLSSNMFNNPILGIAIRETLKWTAIVAAPVGLIVGIFLGSWWSRRRKSP
jgi:ketosteroid isomerase-like protein